jgi:hypothetical protein
MTVGRRFIAMPRPRPATVAREGLDVFFERLLFQ